MSCEALPDPPDDVPFDAAAGVEAVVAEFAGLHGCERDQAFMGVEREIRRLQALQAAMLNEVTVSLSYMDDAHL